MPQEELERSHASAGMAAATPGARLLRTRAAAAPAILTRATLLAPARARADIAELDAGKVAKVEWPDKKNRMLFYVVVTPDAGLWKDASFQFEVKVPKAYPHEPPKVRCVTPIYHPNIDWEGAVCLNILRKDWKPVTSAP